MAGSGPAAVSDVSDLRNELASRRMKITCRRCLHSTDSSLCSRDPGSPSGTAGNSIRTPMEVLL
jgi:hypothetical protein